MCLNLFRINENKQTHVTATAIARPNDTRNPEVVESLAINIVNNHLEELSVYYEIILLTVSNLLFTGGVHNQYFWPRSSFVHMLHWPPLTRNRIEQLYHNSLSCFNFSVITVGCYSPIPIEGIYRAKEF